jgi:hypothetical protein
VVTGAIGVPVIATVALATGPAALVTVPLSVPLGARVSAKSCVVVSPSVTVTVAVAGSKPKADTVVPEPGQSAARAASSATGPGPSGSARSTSSAQWSDSAVVTARPPVTSGSPSPCPSTWSSWTRGSTAG